MARPEHPAFVIVMKPWLPSTLSSTQCWREGERLGLIREGYEAWTSLSRVLGDLAALASGSQDRMFP